MRVLAGVLPAAMVLLPLGVFAFSLQRQQRRELLTPGPTSAGHHQIEGKCELCHTPLRGVTDDACRKCHAAALLAQNDSHAADKFLDPGRADMLSHVDAGSCLACHREHRPEARARNSVSVSEDFCFPCHAQVKQERPSHRDFTPTSCADVGCHNYHDNRALYQELLTRERDVPKLRDPALLPPLSPHAAHGNPLGAADADVPRSALEPPEIARALADWAQSSHAAGGVNCSNCHRDPVGEAAEKSWRVAPATCGSCHGGELAGFHAGKHGMRTAAELPPLTPRQARQPMKPAALAQGRPLDCNSCHRAHDFDLRAAAVEACEGCHDDAHTRAYRLSPHFALLDAERSGRSEPGAAVTCASCHLPRREVKRGEDRRIVAVHNQNDNLRPVDRMARDVCMSCHSLGYALEALADTALVQRNFTGAPVKRAPAKEAQKP